MVVVKDFGIVHWWGCRSPCGKRIRSQSLVILSIVSCTPADTIRTGQAIPGAEVVIMEALGHFPMSEDPERFRGYILPVLEKIRAAA